VKLSHQYTVTITCSMPSLFMQQGGPLPVYTITGDYETVSKALGLTVVAPARGQLDRFEASLNADDPAPT
jgi:hypothetical protein